MNGSSREVRSAREWDCGAWSSLSSDSHYPFVHLRKRLLNGGRTHSPRLTGCRGKTAPQARGP